MNAIRKYLTYVGAATLLALAYWAGAETVAPGQQYPDPWLPCLYVGSLGGGLAWIAVEYVGLIRQYRAERRRRKAITIDVPGGKIEFDHRVTPEEAEEAKRRFLAYYERKDGEQ